MSKIILFLIDDLHLEGRPLEMQIKFANIIQKSIDECIKNNNLPILICAGDISEGEQGIEWVSQFNCETIYICGNHEFWNNDYYELIDLLMLKGKESKYNKIHFLHNQEIILHNIRFLGATLWSELSQSWPWIKRNYALKNFMAMADFRKISAKKFYESPKNIEELFALLSNNGVDKEQINQIIEKKSFNPLLQIQENKISQDFLENKILEPFSGKTVILTHHLPVHNFWINKLNMNKNIISGSYINNKSIYQEYLIKKIQPEKDILMMSFYVNNLNHFFDNYFSPDFWFHGHFHKPIDGFLGTTRVISNPVGYLKQSKEFNIKSIEIGTELNQYIDYSINEINNYNFEQTIKSINEFILTLHNFSDIFQKEKINIPTISKIISLFEQEHEKNLQKMEVFISNILFYLIKLKNKDTEIINQLYITSYISGFGNFALEQKNDHKIGVDLISINIDESSFIKNNKNYRTNNEENSNNYLKWIEDLEKINSQIVSFKKSIINFLNSQKTN